MWQVVTASAIDPLFDGERDDGVGLPALEVVVQHLRSARWREPTKIYFAALDLHQRGGVEWATWRGEADAELRAAQRRDGSWSPEYTWDPVSAAGGDLYATALSIMALSVPYRHAR